MEEKQSTPSNELAFLCLLALMSCIGPILASISPNWIHPRMQVHLSEPGFVYLCLVSILITVFRHTKLSSYLAAAFGLAILQLHLDHETRWLTFLQFDLCFAFVWVWNHFRLKSTLMLFILCMEVSLSFHARVFFDANPPAFTPLSWNLGQPITHQISLLTFPILGLLLKRFSLFCEAPPTSPST